MKKIKGTDWDIVGDIHGEYDALIRLLSHLGYSDEGIHPEGRKLIFVGDIVDRGSKTLSCLKKVKALIDSGSAYAVLGNHEINTLNEDPKTGAGWFFEQIKSKEAEKKYEPYECVGSKEEKNEILSFLNRLPIILESDCFRIVHATWNKEAVEKMVDQQGNYESIKELYSHFVQKQSKTIEESRHFHPYLEERRNWGHVLDDQEMMVPFLENWAHINMLRQMAHPMKILTSGEERVRVERKPMFAGKWRFTERVAWWEQYDDDVPVIIGHYWRRKEVDNTKKDEDQIFKSIKPFEFFGKKKNVFCVDYSIGLMYQKRNGKNEESLHLGALRWPEQKVMLDNGESFEVENKVSIKKAKSPKI